MKRFLSFLMAGLIILFQPINSFAEENGPEESQIDLADNTRSAILIERDTGTILFEKNIHEKLPPASMTKVMTMLLVMEELEAGRLKLDEKVRTSEYAASMGGSQIFLEPGEEMTVEELLRGVAIASANDASVALAERISGSEKAFVQRMNEKAQEIGLKNTKFQNTSGLPASDHYSSAYDMAIMAKELLKYEDITAFTGMYESYLRENTDKKFWLVNTNKLVRFYPGADGLKTGYTSEAKYCLVATAKKGDMRVIAVVFGAPTSKERNKQVSNMLDYAFSQYETKQFYKKGEIVGEVKVHKGDKRTLNAKTGETISVLTKKGENIDNVEQKFEFNKDLTAPIKAGDKIGKLILIKDGKVLTENELVAENDMELASWWTSFKRVFGFFTKTEK